MKKGILNSINLEDYRTLVSVYQANILDEAQKYYNKYARQPLSRTLIF